jgi:hypothetical protein
LSTYMFTVKLTFSARHTVRDSIFLRPSTISLSCQDQEQKINLW